jgi:transcription antitermination factor NusG
MDRQHEKHWHAVLTGSKKEKFVLELLKRKQIECYLPLVKRTRRYASRIKSHELPLISCYVFVCISKAERRVVLETTYAFKFIEFGKQVAVIPPHEMDLMRQIVGEFEDVELADQQSFDTGDEVELIAGDLTGIKGTVIEERGSNRYLVKLESLDLHLMWTIKKIHLRKAT